MRTLFAVFLLLAARVSVAAQHVHYLSLVNNAPADIEAIELVEMDGHATPIAQHDPLRGGDATTLGIPDVGGCRRDLRLTFAGDRRITLRDLDVCRDRVLHARELYVAVLRARNAAPDSSYAATTASGNAGNP
jgi:hypothetical protein